MNVIFVTNTYYFINFKVFLNNQNPKSIQKFRAGPKPMLIRNGFIVNSSELLVRSMEFIIFLLLQVNFNSFYGELDFVLISSFG